MNEYLYEEECEYQVSNSDTCLETNKHTILRKQILEIQHSSLSAAEKSKHIQLLMTKNHNSIHRHSQKSTKKSETNFHDPEKREYGCQHYMTGCQRLAECCKQWTTCRICHDEASDHKMDRHATRWIRCLHCSAEQEPSDECVECMSVLGSYYCDVCKFWDNDRTKDIYHCDDCGICRIGKREDYFHCDRCNACLLNDLQDNHKCIERNLEADCPICGDFLHTSVFSVVFMPCGHSIHNHCFQQYTRSSYQCPICFKSLGNMQGYFERIDEMLKNHVMPEEYLNCRSVVLCNDCEQKSVAKYHFLYHKCFECDSYNTKVLRTVQLEDDQSDSEIPL